MLAKTAKAFPSQIRVGVDVTQLSRFLSIIGKHEKQKNGVTLEGWARRVLNPLERPQWHTKLAQYRECRTDDNARMKLASFMAGRWALKEAAIKAHSQRVLHLREISILPVSTEYSTTLGYSQDPPKPGHGRTPKPSVLIDPPSRMVKFRDETVWRRRGIMENSHGVHHGDIWVPLRSARIDMQDRQMADGSISHDGDYVFAMCQALDHVWSKEDLRIEDDGNGPQIHEPEKGDEGWQEQALSL